MQSFAKAAGHQSGMHFIIGRDKSDRWVVLETHGLSGGLFTDETSALRFARDESQGRPCAIEITDARLDFRVF